MSLHPSLNSTPMTHLCPACKNPTNHLGSWFRAISVSYSCHACGNQVQMTYLDKLVLFAKYATP